MESTACPAAAPQALTPDTALIRSPDLISADMDGDTVMMSLERGAYFGIGGVGPRVWELLAEPITVARITQAICTEYAVDAATCQADMHRFAQALLQDRLVRVA